MAKSSYQKQKDIINRLRFDIRALRGKEGFENKVIVETSYRIQDEFENAVWIGKHDTGKYEDK